MSSRDLLTPPKQKSSPTNGEADESFLDDDFLSFSGLAPSDVIKMSDQVGCSPLFATQNEYKTIR